MMADSEAPYSTGESVLGSEPGAIPSDANPRQGHLFLGFLCDMRIATVAVNAVNILLTVIMLAIDVFKLGFDTPVSSGYLSILLSAIGIFGALQYEYLPAGVAGLGFFISMTGNLIRSDWVGGLYYAFMLYPHAVVTNEIRSGVMTQTTYTREEYIDPKVREQLEKYGM